MLAEIKKSIYGSNAVKTLVAVMVHNLCLMVGVFDVKNAQHKILRRLVPKPSSRVLSHTILI